jgi:hypothetical protein
MNVSFLHDKTFREDLTTRWAQWKKHKKFYPNCVLWWGRYVKRTVRQLFTSEGTNGRRDRQTLENFYYDAIYNILQDATLTDTTYVTLKKLKAKIVRLHHEHKQRLFLPTHGRPGQVWGWNAVVVPHSADAETARVPDDRPCVRQWRAPPDVNEGHLQTSLKVTSRRHRSQSSVYIRNSWKTNMTWSQ